MSIEKKDTKKQLENLLKKAEDKIIKWNEYRMALEVALSSNPPGKPPRPPRG